MSEPQIVPDDNEMYVQAVDLVRRENKVATSFIQRHLRIGYNRAHRTIEEMERRGVISAANNMGVRTVISQTLDDQETKDVGGVQGQRLTSFIERVERLEEEKSALMEDIKEVYAEAKGVGFDVKAIRKLIALRKMDANARHEAESILDLYKSAVGMV